MTKADGKKAYETSIKIAGLSANVENCDLLNTKHKCYELNNNVQPFATKEIQRILCCVIL
jgi:hypothetical protein